MAKSQKRINDNRLLVQIAVTHLIEELLSVQGRSAREFEFWTAIESLIESRYGDSLIGHQDCQSALRSVSRCFMVEIPGVRVRNS